MARSNDPLVVGRVIGDVLEEFQPFAELTVKYAARQVVTDPDAPSPSEPSAKEFLHWLVTDIPSGADASAGRQILPYEEPKPPIGIHRYVFAVFKQQQPLPLIAPSTRKKFNTKGFAQQFGLGKPAAAVYFNSQKETGARRR